jgi:hypothetical protein
MSGGPERACRACIYWHHLEHVRNCYLIDAAGKYHRLPIGECRAAPPVQARDPYAFGEIVHGVWPRVEDRDWCGAFTPAEPSAEAPRGPWRRGGE